MTNYHRFYALLKLLTGGGTDEEVKADIIHQYTHGRTTHLTEMTPDEYRRCCADLEERTGQRELLKRRRSQCLHLMQQLGIDTTDWARIDTFCRNPRIAGKPFARITPSELTDLASRLRAILRKGGLKGASTSVDEKEQRVNDEKPTHQTHILLWTPASDTPC